MRDLKSVPDNGRTSASETPVLVHFAGLTLDVDACRLERQRGDEIALTRGEFALLRFFVSRPGRALSRDALLDVMAGRRFESIDRSVDVMIGRLRRKIEPDQKAPRIIVTVPGVGYKFAAAVRKAASTATLELNPAAINAESHARGPAVATPPGKPDPPRLSLVVLPFANIGGDPEQEDFIDGVTESLTTDLSRIAGAFVVGRSTAFTYRGKAGDVKQIALELNVRYVLEGSVQRSGESMRVNAQLLEAETGTHLWAERFDKPIADLFKMQDEIVARLATRSPTG